MPNGKKNTLKIGFKNDFFLPIAPTLNIEILELLYIIREVSIVYIATMIFVMITNSKGDMKRTFFGRKKNGHVSVFE